MGEGHNKEARRRNLSDEEDVCITWEAESRFEIAIKYK